ncbi:MAG: hypothetical protein MZV70_62820 [Desulfobacterales bacterium]|nr:hypothetical protein [Desulfobacterales bacterium]
MHGVDREGEARVVELTSHRFFLATLFLPQLASSLEAPHPADQGIPTCGSSLSRCTKSEAESRRQTPT